MKPDLELQDAVHSDLEWEPSINPRLIKKRGS